MAPAGVLYRLPSVMKVTAPGSETHDLSRLALRSS